MSMIKRVLAAFGIGLAVSTSASAAALYKPYAESYLNFLYNMLFCDDVNLFRNDQTTQDEGLWPTLLAGCSSDLKALGARSPSDVSNEGRIRASRAFNRLRAAGETVPTKIVLRGHR